MLKNKEEKKKIPQNLALLFITSKKTKLMDNTLSVIHSRPVTITGKQHLIISYYTFAYTFGAANLSVRPESLSPVLSP